MPPSSCYGFEYFEHGEGGKHLKANMPTSSQPLITTVIPSHECYLGDMNAKDSKFWNEDVTTVEGRTLHSLCTRLGII